MPCALTDATVQQAAAGYLAAQPRPSGVSSWGLASGTGAADGRTAVVRLQGRATIPVLASVVEVFGGSVTSRWSPGAGRPAVTDGAGGDS